MRHWINLIESIQTPAEQMIEAFEDAFEVSPLKGHVNVSLWHHRNEPPDVVELSHIRTERRERNEGWGNKAMSMLCDFADKYQVILTLGIAEDADGSHGSMNRDQLHDFYTKWGFEGGSVMKRYPDEPLDG